MILLNVVKYLIMVGRSKIPHKQLTSYVNAPLCANVVKIWPLRGHSITMWTQRRGRGSVGFGKTTDLYLRLSKFRNAISFIFMI